MHHAHSMIMASSLRPGVHQIICLSSCVSCLFIGIVCVVGLYVLFCLSTICFWFDDSFCFFVQCQSPSLLEVNVQTLLCAANLIPLGLLINSFASHVEAGVKAKAIADLVPTTVEGCRTAADNKQPSSAELLYNTLGSHIKPIVQKIQETLQLEAILNRSNTESDESESKKHKSSVWFDFGIHRQIQGCSHRAIATCSRVHSEGCFKKSRLAVEIHGGWSSQEGVICYDSTTHSTTDGSSIKVFDRKSVPLHLSLNKFWVALCNILWCCDYILYFVICNRNIPKHVLMFDGIFW